MPIFICIGNKYINICAELLADNAIDRFNLVSIDRNNCNILIKIYSGKNKYFKQLTDQ